jgi:chromosome segregation ATPase
MEQTHSLEADLQKLESKVKAQEETLKRKSQREDVLLSELDIYDSKVQSKELEIEHLHTKLVQFETFRHKFEVKKKEADMLLSRVEELSQLNGSLADQIVKKQTKNQKLTSQVEEMKVQVKLLKNDHSNGNSLDNSLFYEGQDQVYNKVIDIEHLSPTRNYAKKVIEMEQIRFKRTDSLK